MGVVYPLAFPDFAIAEVGFDIDYANTYSQSRGGRYNVMSVGPDLWKATVVTTILVGDNYDLWRAWVTSLRGGAGSFYMYDVRRRFPQSYKSGWNGLVKAAGGAFTGVATLENVDTGDSHVVTLGGLPAGFVIKPGDYMAFDYNSNTMRALHRVSIDSGGIANGLGFVSGISVEPAVRPLWSVGANVMLESPSCVMTVMQPYNEKVLMGRSNVGQTKQIIQFDCIQTLIKQ